MTSASYQNSADQSLKGTIVLLTDFYSEYQRQVSDPLRHVIEQAGYGFIVVAGAYVTGKSFSGNTRKDRNAIFDVIKSFDAKGVILMTTSVCHQMEAAEMDAFIAEFRSIPLVCVGQEVSSTNSVSLDNNIGMNDCMDFLLQADDNQTFAFVAGVKSNTDSGNREDIFRRALLDSGRSVHEELVVHGDFIVSTSHRATLKMMENRRDVDVIVCANDESALGAIYALETLGLSVPDDVRVTGFDDSAETTRSRPTISSVSQPYYEIAIRAVELLLKSMENPSMSVISESIKTEFIARESTLCPSQENPRITIPEIEYAQRSHELAESVASRIKQPTTPMSIPHEELLSALFEAGCGNWQPMAKAISNHLNPQTLTVYDVNWWQNLAAAIETHGNQLPNSKILDILQTCLGSSVQQIKEVIRQWRIRQEFEAKRIAQIYQKFMADVSVATSEESVCEHLAEWMSNVGIPRGYLVVYSEITDQPSVTAHLTLNYCANRSTCVGEQSAFPTSELLPESLQSELNKGFLVAHSITAGGLQFGYFLFEPILLSNIEFDAVIDCLGNAMLHVYQVGQMKLRAEDLQQANERLSTLANYDELTKLPNRAYFKQNLQAALANADHNNLTVALAFIDLDGFKIINDSLGHTAGDDLLKIVADRLTAVLGHDATLSRLGGDEFTVILSAGTPDDDIVDKINVISTEILNSLASPYELSELAVNVSASVGVALYPTDAHDMESLISKADVAMYYAKESGKNCLRLYTPELDCASGRQLEQDHKMRAGLSNDEFYLVYQPKFRLSDYTIVGAEALLRWRSDSSSDQPNLPGEFIPIAERTGFITQLDEFVLSSACKALNQWKQQNIALPLAVNVSAVHIHKPEFVDMVADSIRTHGIDPGLLEIEITESAAMEDVEQSVEQLTKLQQLGVSISIDDFGTGYSSLNYLKRLPVNTLKIDQSFLRDVGSGTNPDEQGVAICKAIIALGKSMHYNVIAEGIEHKYQYDLLSELGCDQGQGYFFSRPVIERVYTELLLWGPDSIAM